MSGPLIVSDTSPLNYLVLIGAVDLLPKLVSGVLIPPAVSAELADHRTPNAVRQWLSTSLQCLEIIAPLLAVFLRYRIGMGKFAQFLSESNRHWLANPSQRYHQRVFPSAPKHSTLQK